MRIALAILAGIVATAVVFFGVGMLARQLLDRPIDGLALAGPITAGLAAGIPVGVLMIRRRKKPTPAGSVAASTSGRLLPPVLDDATAKTICPRCGAANGESDQFCGDCGALLKQAPTQAPIAAQVTAPSLQTVAPSSVPARCRVCGSVADGRGEPGSGGGATLPPRLCRECESRRRRTALVSNLGFGVSTLTFTVSIFVRPKDTQQWLGAGAVFWLGLIVGWVFESRKKRYDV